METVRIPKKEYNRLKKIESVYSRISETLYENLLEDSVDDIVSDFRETNLYADEFLYDLENGLKKSSYQTNRKI